MSENENDVNRRDFVTRTALAGIANMMIGDSTYAASKSSIKNKK
jgi:hypothetical protein